MGKPRAKLSNICKVIGKQLEIHVAKDPVRGKARAHLVQFMADEFDVPKRAITDAVGAYNINKQLRITAPKNCPA